MKPIFDPAWMTKTQRLYSPGIPRVKPTDTGLTMKKKM